MGRIFGYWNVRGLGMPIRLMLAYLGVEYEEKRYIFTDSAQPREEWLAEKRSLGLDFPNLPYWKDGDVKLTESRAILRHIARCHDLSSTLLPKDPTLACKVDMMENVIFEALSGIALFACDYDASKEEDTLKALNGKLKDISRYLDNKKWITGDLISLADFWLYETLVWYTTYEKDFLKPYVNLLELKRRFEELQATKNYMQEPSYIIGPCINPMAKKKI